MTENVENLLIEHLRVIRAEVASVREDLREVKGRLSNLEAGQGTIVQHLGHLVSSIAQQQVSVDRLGERVERIERRLNLADADS